MQNTKTQSEIIAEYADRIASLMRDLEATQDDIKAVKVEAKAHGLCPKTLAIAVKLRRDAVKRIIFDTQMDLLVEYRHALEEGKK